MNGLEFTFLTEEQISGDNQLDILKKYGRYAAITDFAILLGGFVSDIEFGGDNWDVEDWRWIPPLGPLEDRSGWYWTKSLADYYNVYVNGAYAGFHHTPPKERKGGVRPALPYLSISSISSNAVRGEKGILEVEYGEYPQTVVSRDLNEILERAYSNGTIRNTDKTYTTDSVCYNYYDTPFKARPHVEYEYNGKKYIRFLGDSNCSGKVLSDGRIVQEGSPYWVEVEPIKWMIDEETNIALSKKLLFSGVQFDNTGVYTGCFEKTDIYRFLNDIFAKDIIPSVINKTATKEKNEIKSGVNSSESKQSSILKDINEKILLLDLEMQNVFFRKLSDILKSCETDSKLVVERMLELQSEIDVASQNVVESEEKLK